MALIIPIITEFSGKGIAKAKKEFAQLETVGQKAGFILKKSLIPATAAAAGLAAAGVQVGQALWGMAEAAAEDQQSQIQLAKALERTTKATSSQVAGVEDFIDVTQRATGIADDKLRPAFANLVRYTKDITEAQKLMTVAVDISTARNLDLTQVSMALGKAYSGNFNALKKLGVPMSGAIQAAKLHQDAITKQAKASEKLLAIQGQIADHFITGKDATKALTKAQEDLAKANTLVADTGKENTDWVGSLKETFGGAAAANAGTFAGKMQLLKIRMDEFKESIGYKLLGPLTTLADGAIKVADAFGEKGLGGALMSLRDVSPGFYNFMRDTYNYMAAVVNLAYNGKRAIGQFFDMFKGKFSIPRWENFLPTWEELTQSTWGMSNNTGGSAPVAIVRGVPGLAGPVGGTPGGVPVGSGPAGIQSSGFGRVAQQINVTVTSADPRAVVDALVKYNRQNGAIPVAVTG